MVGAGAHTQVTPGSNSPLSRHVFTLTLFGGLSLEGRDGPLDRGARQRRRLSLLALLAVAGERGLTRDRVQSFLWPDSDAARARHALDQLLYTTRKHLAAEAVVSLGADLRLNGTVVASDVATFDEAIRGRDWERAVAAYAGPLLDGVHLLDDPDAEQWLDVQRIRREHEHRGALEALAEAAEREGDARGSLHWRRLRAEAEPLSAPATLRLMEALARAGDSAGAVTHAARHAALVRATLGVEPDPAVTAFARGLPPSASAPQQPPVGPPTAAEASAPRAIAPAAPAPAPAARAPHRLRRRWAVAAVAGLAGAVTLLATTDARSRERAALTIAPYGGRAPASAPLMEAQALHRRGEVAWNRRTREGLEEAVVLFRRAAEREPGYAAAYSGLAKSYALLGYFGFGPGDGMFAKAKAAATRALELEPGDGDAWAALGQALAWEHDWTAAERAHRRGVEIDPRNPTAHQWYALLLAYMGRSREAALHTSHASRLDPLSVQVNNMYGMMLYHAGELDSALGQFRRTVEEEPDSAWVQANPWVLENYAAVLVAAGRYAEAERLIGSALDVVPGHPRPLLTLARLHIRAGRPERGRAAFAAADSGHPHHRIYRGMLHVSLGELDSAFALFDEVDEWPLPALVGLNSRHMSDAFREDARYAGLRRRLGFADRPRYP